MTPFLADPDVTLYHGDVLDVLRDMPAESVDCVVTSPPFYALRDYGVAGQIGLEATPEEWCARLVEVFREVRRVLCDHGTFWLEIGDTFRDKGLIGTPWTLAFALREDGWLLRSEIIWSRPNPMPESVTDRPTKAHSTVFLLTKQPKYFFDQEAVREGYTEGTIERGYTASKVRDGIGKKTNANPDRNGGWGEVRAPFARPTPQEETLDGSDGEAPRGPDGRRATHVEARDGSIQHRDGERWPNTGRNVRSVWTIATQPYPEAHFATYPEELVRRCVLAGSPERVCVTCGEPSVRQVDVSYGKSPAHGSGSIQGSRGATPDDTHLTGGYANKESVHGQPRVAKIVDTVGWSDCGHNTWRPGRVLDPFVGSGTTCKVARDHGRHSIGIDLNADYLALAAKRLQQQSLFSEIT